MPTCFSVRRTSWQEVGTLRRNDVRRWNDWRTASPLVARRLVRPVVSAAPGREREEPLRGCVAAWIDDSVGAATAPLPSSECAPKVVTETLSVRVLLTDAAQ